MTCVWLVWLLLLGLVSPTSSSAPSSPLQWSPLRAVGSSRSSSGSKRSSEGVSEGVSRSRSKSKVAGLFGSRVKRSAVAAEADRKHQQREKEALYEAYNLLHSLAQDYQKPFDAPAVLVVGHQTSGKSALIEALMGFQFNQVGGGTKTRRPIALRMQYNASCDVPRCFLTMENGIEQMTSLDDIQSYIASENLKLERDPNRCFDSREINIRMEYKHCPNMILIDTPGLIHAPKGERLSVQQRALAQASKEAENLVLEKMKCEDYIILCVEDTTDWKHATTRNIVMQADPTLNRTVLVTTKLDTKLTQFSEGKDVEHFIKAPLIESLFPQLYGGPFYTSVPAGRVGDEKAYTSNQAFVKAINAAELDDEEQINSKLRDLPVSLSSSSEDKSILLQNVGVSKLRSYLERRVDDCYRRNVAKIIPQLQSDHRRAEEKLSAMDNEINSLSIENIRRGANVYREAFAKQLSQVIHGTAKVSPDEWGETLDTETNGGGGYLDSNAGAAQSEAWKLIVSEEVGNSQHKLFGGAQYHRALREFSTAVKHMNFVAISEDEIANAAGVGDMHDGVNFMRAACVLALNKAQSTFDPMLETLQSRCTHVMHRLFPLVDNLITDDINEKASRLAISPYSKSTSLKSVVKQIYNQFINDQMEWCLDKCRDDLRGMTRFVTWDTEGKGGSSSLYNSLPTPKSMVEIYNVAAEGKELESNEKMRSNSMWGWRPKWPSQPSEQSMETRIFSEWKQANEQESYYRKPNQLTPSGNKLSPIDKSNAEVSDYYDLLRLMDEMVSTRNEKRTSVVVTTLVEYIIRSWREHFAKSVAQKFNCFFLLPFIDDFPNYLRSELDKLYANDNLQSSLSDDLFDITETRNNLLEVRDSLITECAATAELQTKFDQINAQLGQDSGRR